MKQDRTDVEALRRELASRIDELVPYLFPRAKRTGATWRIGSLEGEAGTSLTIVREGAAAGGWKNHNPGDGDGSGDVLALIARRFGHTSFPETLDWARTWLGLPSDRLVSRPPVGEVEKAKVGDRAERANEEFLRRRERRLETSEAACAWLAGRGIRLETARRFRLGLSEPYTDTEGVLHRDALTAPVLDREGRPLKRSVYYNIPGLTTAPAATNGWCKGSPETYYGENRRSQQAAFICEGLKDLWRLAQALKDAGAGSDVLLLSSTHGSAVPEEWKQTAFWQTFKTVYLGHDNDAAGDQIARQVATSAGREMLRARPPRGKDWTDFLSGEGGSVEEFHELLAEAQAVGEIVWPASESGRRRAGRFAYAPVDVLTAAHRGRLYYPVRTILQVLAPVAHDDGAEAVQVLGRRDTVLVRSDRTLHSIRVMPAPPGTPPEEKLYQLTPDGTLVESPPRASRYSTWSWPSIEAYVAGKARTRDLGAIVEDVYDHLSKSVWLPYAEDYAMLALLVPVTYAQNIFESVPMILAVGPAGTGKSQLGRAMARLCANAAVIGQTSAAAIARHIHEARGFVVLDDLEAVARRAGRDAPQFSELVQALKLSYKKSTAVKIWTDVSRGMRTEELNFYGVKMINNTSGLDAILGSRMLRVQTRRMPEGLKSVSEAFDARKLAALRDELHTWTFEHVGLVEDTYRRLCPGFADRSEEIAAPLRVFAELAGNEILRAELERHLDRTRNAKADPDDPEELMREAMRRLVADGYKSVATTHVVLEMKTLVDQNQDRRFTNEIPQWEDPAWLGRMLRSHDLVDAEAPPRRMFLFGKSLRVYPVRDHFLIEVLGGQEVAETREPSDFCSGCAGCRYRNAGCPIMERRLGDEKKSSPKPH